MAAMMYMYMFGKTILPKTYSISLEGTVVLPVYNSGAGGTWSKLGPFRANIADGAINVSANGGHACVIWYRNMGGHSHARQYPSSCIQSALLIKRLQ